MNFTGAARARVARVLLSGVVVGSALLGVGVGAGVVAGVGTGVAEAAPAPVPQIVDSIARTPAGNGYWLAAPGGAVYAMGGAKFHGSLLGKPKLGQVVGIAAAPNGKGYWLATSGGGVYGFGSAKAHGRPAPSTIRGQIVSIAVTRTGKGYWLLSSEGSVYAEGDARWYGSTYDKPMLGWPVALVRRPGGDGYWIATSAGGVYAFGAARSRGHPRSSSLRGSIVGMAATPDGRGYWLVSSKGSVYPEGDARWRGSRFGSRISGTMTAMAMGAKGRGYWLVSTGGSVYSYGVRNYGSTLPFAPGATGYDVSKWQCAAFTGAKRNNLPGGAHSFAVVQAAGSALARPAPASCLTSEARWAGVHLMAYIFMNPDPKAHASRAAAYAYGYNRAVKSVAYARAHGVTSRLWWVDVETNAGWSFTAANQAKNALEIAGAIAGLTAAGTEAGLYSTPYQWGRVTGRYGPKVPGILLWIPGARKLGKGVDSASDVCNGTAAGYTPFAGGKTVLVQYGYRAGGGTSYSVDHDFACA